MAKTKTKQEEGIELIENPDALASKAEDFFNDKKNQSLVFGIGGVLALIIVAFLGYRYYYLIQARAYALTGDAYSELDDYVAAEAAYKKAADYKPNAEFTPIYLIKLAVNYEAQGKYKPAADAYGKIVSEYKNSSFFQDAQKHKARLDGLAAE